MKNNKNILILDDEKNVLSALERLLHGSFEPDFCNNPLDALEMVRNGNYKVVISDISMPLMDGIKFIEEVTKIDSDVVTVILTGHSTVENAIDAINKGSIFRFLSKPINKENIIKAIEDSLEQHSNIIAKKRLFNLEKEKADMESMIRALSKVIEIRDPYTAGHQKDVAALSVTIAQNLGWDEDKIRGLNLAAIVHDIGKIYVPAEFLSKPGKLTSTEFSIIKQHPVVGHEILDTVNFNWPISTIVYQHHEKLDGSGYPNQLKGDEILDEAQIIAVCDTYDAMISHRPYRAALEKDKVVAYLKSTRGTQYKAEYVDELLKVIT